MVLCCKNALYFNMPNNFSKLGTFILSSASCLNIFFSNTSFPNVSLLDTLSLNNFPLNTLSPNVSLSNISILEILAKIRYIKEHF